MLPNPIQENAHTKPFTFEAKNVIQNKNHDCVSQPRDLKKIPTYFIEAPWQTLGLQNKKTKRQHSFRG